MTRKRILLDTSYVQALLNKRDRDHCKAVSLLSYVKNAHEVWITEAVLVEIGNGLSSIDRIAAEKFIKSCYKTSNINVITVDTVLFLKSLELYSRRSDKNWGITDCISFFVMQENGIFEAATNDEHFIQAGFIILMKD
jgi:uncharacterized protein